MQDAWLFKYSAQQKTIFGHSRELANLPNDDSNFGLDEVESLNGINECTRQIEGYY